MSVDPYHAVQSEIQSSLATAEQLRASFLRIRSTAHEGSEELEWVHNEVSAK
jgi:Syntaxin 6, N-terminal